MNIIIRRRNNLLGLGCIFFLLFFLSCHHITNRENRSPQPECNVVLITLDTLRADHLGCYGNKNVKTPHRSSEVVPALGTDCNVPSRRLPPVDGRAVRLLRETAGGEGCTENRVRARARWAA